MNKLSGLSLQYLKQNKHRTITTVIGVMFSSMIIYIIFTAGYSAYEATAYTSYEYTLGWDAVYNCDEETARNILTLDSYYGQSAVIDDSDFKISDAFAFASIYECVIAINDFEAMPVPFKMIYGTTPKSENTMIVSQGTARIVKLKVGDLQTLNLVQYVNDKVISNETTKQVSGIYEDSFGIYIDSFNGNCNIYLDSDTFFVKMDDNIWKKADEENGIFVCVTFTDKKNLEAQAKLLSESFGNCPYYMNSAAIDYFTSNDSIIYLSFNAFILMAAAVIAFATLFIIRNAFNISVHERNYDYGILRCIGMSRRQIIKIILYEAVFISVTGVILGMLLGHGIVALGFYYIRNMLDLSLAYHVRFYIKALLLTILFSFVTTAYAMIAPIQQLYRLNPIEALHKSEDIHQKKLKHKNGKGLTKLFGVEVGYAYKNVMRRKGRFLITVATLTIGVSLFVSIMTAFSIIEKSYTSIYDVYGYDGYFKTVNYEEALQIRKELEALELVDESLSYYADMILDCSPYIFELGQGFDGSKLIDDGFELVLNDCGLLIKLSSDKSTKVFDEFINNSQYYFIDTMSVFKSVFKMFDAVKGIVIIFLVLLLIIFITNNININRSDMILRREELRILQIIGMSYKQESKMLYSESLISSITALILGSIIGTLIGFGLSYMFLLNEFIENNAHLSVSWLSIIVSAVVLIIFSILSVFLSREQH